MTIRLLAAALCCFAALISFGCGGGAEGDRGVESGSGTVDASAADPVAALDPTTDWPMWRGPNRNGVAIDQDVPVEFGPGKNVVWKAKLPGRGHASPTIVGDRVYLATADESEQTQSVLALDRGTGEGVWTRELHRGGFPEAMHRKNSHASSTVACDGERLFATFLNHDAIHATALDLDGEILWQKEIGDFDSKFGYAPSPTLYKSSLIVAADHQEGGHVTSLDRESGTVNWQIKRPAVATYSSAIVHEVGGKDQLLISGARRVTSYDPVDGGENWSVEGTAEATVGTLVVEGNHVFASGGYPERETLAIDAISGKDLWRSRDKSYVPSLIVHDGAVYVVDDDGTARCYDAETGEIRWRERLNDGRDFSASAILVDDRLYTISEGGTCYVLAADPEQFERLAKNRLGDEAFATPVAAGNRLYFRVAENSGGRQEWLYCFGEAGAE